MSYKNQILKQVNNGKCGKKYFKLVKRKQNVTDEDPDSDVAPNDVQEDLIICNTSEKMTIPESNVNVEITHDIVKEKNVFLDDVVEKKDSSKTIFHDVSEKNDTIEEKIDSPKTVMYDVVEKKPVFHKDVNQDQEIIESFQKKIMEFENLILGFGEEMENLKSNQINIVNVINRLSMDVSNARNKIVR